MKRIIIFLMAFIVLVGPAYAFSDGFNDGDITDWTQAGGGTWTNPQTGSWDNSGYLSQSFTGTNQIRSITNSQSSNNIYWETKFNFASTTGGANTLIEFDFKQNSTSNPINQYSCGGASTFYVGWCMNGGGVLSANGFNYVGAPNLNLNQWYRLVVSQSGSNMRVRIYNATGGNTSLIDDRTGAITADIVGLTKVGYSVKDTGGVSHTVTAYFDDIVASSVVADATTSVSWDESEYVVGAYPSFTWNIRDNDWFNCWPCNYYAWVKVDGNDFGISKIGDSILYDPYIAIGTQTGSYSFTTGKTGAYTVELRRGWTVFDADTVNSDNMYMRAATNPYLLIPEYAAVKTNVTVTYNLGSGGVMGYITTNLLKNGVEQNERYYNLGAAISGTSNITFAQEGTYIVYLSSYTGNNPTSNILAKKTVNVYMAKYTGANNFSSSSIKTSNSTYHRGDAIRGNYTVDGVNYSSGIQYIDVYNWASGAVTARFYFDSSDPGSDSLLIGAKDYGTFFYYADDQEATDVSPAITWFPGLNALRLMLLNSSGIATQLAYVNFTLLSVNDGGYALEVTPKSVEVGQTVYITYTVPNNASYLEIFSDDYVSGKVVGYYKRINLSSGTKTIQQSFSQAGYYNIALFDNIGGIQYSKNINVFKPGVAPTPTSSAPVGFTDDEYENQKDFITVYKNWVYSQVGTSDSTKFFLSLIHIGLAALVFGGLTKFKMPFVIIFGAFLGVGFSVVIGFMDRVWAVALLVIAGYVVMKIVGK